MARLTFYLTFLLSLFWESGAAPVLGRKDAPIVIVGAGAAGLAAAQRLFELGFTDVTVLEAQERTGGRVHSQGTNGGFVELGAQQVHGSQQPVYDFAAEKGYLTDLPNATVIQNSVYRTENGKELSPEDLVLLHNGKAVFDKITLSYSNRTRLTAQQLQNNSLEADRGNEYNQYFSSLNRTMGSEQTQSLTTLAYDYSIRLEMIETSCPAPELALSYRYYTDFTQHGRNRALKPDISYESILKNMTAPFPRSWIKVNTPIKSIRVTTPIVAGKRLLVCSTNENQTAFPADHVIVTISLGVLKASNSLFVPALSPKKQEAITKAGFGSVTKLFLTFSNPFWEEFMPNDTSGIGLLWTNSRVAIPHDSTLSKGEPWFRSALHITRVSSSQNTLLVWVSGSGATAVDELTDEQVKMDCWELLKNFSGSSLIPQPKELLRAKWSTNPYTRGTYSYFSLNSSRANLTPADLAEPEWEFKNELADGKTTHSLLFAGEATHPDFFSTVHGAILSGQREADRIASYYTTDTSTANHLGAITIYFYILTFILFFNTL